MSSDLLFELGTEELPSAAVWSLADALGKEVLAALAEAQLAHGVLHTYATPRRLAVWVAQVQSKQAAQTVSRRGPSVAATTSAEGTTHPALLGFAKSCQVAVSELQQMTTDKGVWWCYEAQIPGVETRQLLPALICKALAGLAIAKPMRWGAGDTEFARPLHWAVLLYGEDCIEADILGVRTGRESFGHRFHHPQAITIHSAGEYAEQLRRAQVVADFAERRRLIEAQVTQLAKAHHGHALMPAALLDEVTSIVEWPHALLVPFDPKFLQMPPEVLIASMQVHQKCFALQDNQGNLQPYFITVANIASSHPHQVIAGNEKVMRARLSDAAFFYQQDTQIPLLSYAKRTEQVVFQDRLGTLQEKTVRMQALVAYLTEPLLLNAALAQRAVALAKCDLMTGMVGEFPELQGVIGYYYAMHDGEDAAVAEAIKEQYLPRFSGDLLPQTPLGLALSLADRIDTLVGNFAIGQKPTGMKDPFKLRRHALAVLRLLITAPVALELTALLQQGLSSYHALLTENPAVLAELHTFILERLPAYYQSVGISTEVIQAVCARENNWLADMDKRIQALQAFIQLPAAVSLSAACKRVNNILQHAGGSYTDLTIDTTLFIDPAESVLFAKLNQVEQVVRLCYETSDYRSILTQLAGLREPVDSFFEHVMVMVDELACRENRLRLLARLRQLLQGVADISLLSLGS